MQDEIAKIENRLEKLKRPINGSDSDDEAPGSDEGGNDGALPPLPPTPSPCRGRYPPPPHQPDPDHYYIPRSRQYPPCPRQYLPHPAKTNPGRPQTPPSPIGSPSSPIRSPMEDLMQQPNLDLSKFQITL